TQTLTVTASSSNTGLIPTPTVSYTSANATGSISYTPVGNANGTATITVTVNDGGGTANGGVESVSQTFAVAVTAVNDAPTLNAIGNVTIYKNWCGQTVNLSGIGTGAANETQTLTVTASSSNTGLIPTPTVSYTSANATGSISFAPVPNTSGTVTITVTTSDNGGTANGGVDTFSRTFAVAVDTALNVTYNTATDVALTTDCFTATGNTVNFTLNFGPLPGTELTVVRKTGLSYISGTFDNLTNGQTVVMGFGGTNYNFVANYYGGSGNDLVLVWKGNRAYAWGRNNLGQLGDTTITQRNAPVAVTNSGALFGKTIVALASGGTHSLALCSDGTVVAWGGNGSGQLGDNTTTTRTFPVAVNTAGALNGKTVVAIAASGVHSLALCSDGTVAAWGRNVEGQLGLGAAFLQTNVPAAVSTSGALSGKTVVGIAAGSVGNFAHSLALCSDGTVVAWGYNANGQLGDASTTQRNAPVAVNTNSGVSALNGKSVVSIAAGDSHSVALCADGTVASWGANASGQLGDASFTQTNAPVAVNASSGTSSLFGKTVTGVAGGVSFSLALCSDGTVHAWGLNNNGQPGTGVTGVNTNAPVAVNTSSGVSALFGKTVTAIAAGAGHNVVLATDGTLAGWGLNTFGQVGNNTATTTNAPAAVDGSALAAGERFIGLFRNSVSTHSLALVGVPLSAPTDISLSASSVPENQTSGTNVCVLSATDANAGDTATFTFASGAGDTGNASFSISNGTNLVTAAMFDYEVQNSYSIRLRVTDSSGLTYEEQFTITVIDDLTELPTITAASTDEDVQTTSGLVITANSSAATHYKVTAISGGTLYQNDGTTAIANNDFITVGQGTAGLKFTPSTNSTSNGSFTVQSSTAANDGGLGASAPVFTTITVNSVNDVPSFVKGVDQHPLQNSGLTTVTGWATAISTGPANESGQTASFLVSNNNNPMFSVQPAVAADGTLTFTLAADTLATATVTVQVQDDGGTANGGVDTSAGQTFVIAVPSRYSSGSVATAAGPASLSLADYNGDKFNDIFVANATAGTVTLLLNNGSGSFVMGTNITVGSGPAAIALADFNADGKRDVVVANFNDDNVSIKLSYGVILSWGMTSAVPATVSVGDGPAAIAIGDGKSFNNDNKADIAVANYNDNTVSILLGVGNGTFTSASGSPIAVGTGPASMERSDFNKDGNLDFTVVCAGDNAVRVYLGAGDGTFTQAPSSPVSVGSNPRSVAVGDINKDGNPDMAVANATDNNVTILLGVGDGTFTNPAPATVTVGTTPMSVTLVDMDGDAKVDLVTANQGANTVTVRLGNGDGTFGNAEHYSVGSGPSAVAARALTGYLPTIVTANSGDGTVSILANIVPLALAKAVSLLEDSTAAIALSATGTGTLNYTLKTAPTNGVIKTNSVTISSGSYPATLGAGASNVTYCPNTNFSGGDSFTFAVDTGGVESSAAKVTLNVTAVNEAPTFDLNTNLLVAVAEDYPSLVTVSNFVTNIIKGPGIESNQTITFTLVATTPAFFITKPAVNAAGRLTFRPALQSNGVQYVSIYGKDSGGTANGGWATSSTQTFAITVTSSNDRPTISVITDRVGREDAATNISFTVGDADNDPGSLTLTVSSSNTGLVPNGNLLLGGGGTSRTLLITPVANSNGFTYITNIVSDGILSTTRVFKVTFQPVNDAPSFTMFDTSLTLARNSGTVSTTNWILTSSPGPADETAQTIKYTLTNHNTNLFSPQPGITNGILTVKGASNAIGTTTLNVVAKDSGNTLFGGVTSSTQSLTLTLTWRAGDLIVADRGPAGVGGAIFAVNTNTGAQTLITTNFYDPVALAFATNGDLIVVDYDALPDDPSFGAVYRISKSTLAQTVVSSGADFAEPVGVAVEADDSILVADSDAYSNLGAVFRVHPISGVKTLLASNFTQLAGIAVSTNGAIYVTDEGTGSVIEIDPVTGVATTVASAGVELTSPVGIAVEPGTGDLIVVNKATKKLLRVTTGGAVSVINGSTDFVNEPTHVAIDANGDFFVTDGMDGSPAGQRHLYRVDKTTGALTLLSSDSDPGAVIDQPRGVGVAQ
ncbi:MAG: VCBS repeat-containing protein, partial [Verrucomicrobia bacterium]|nr:VCBS repeat-containing protein [Verrucomicrobiota bacterium]